MDIRKLLKLIEATKKFQRDIKDGSIVLPADLKDAKPIDSIGGTKMTLGGKDVPITYDADLGVISIKQTKGETNG